MKSISPIIFIALLLASFQSFGQTSVQKKELLSGLDVESALINKCYVCHNPRVKKSEDMIAPPMVSVKYIYKLRYPGDDDFVDMMTYFVLEPNDKTAIMQGRVLTHGAMPDLSFDEDEVRKIARYILENEIEVPSWYPEYFEKKYGDKWVSQ